MPVVEQWLPAGAQCCHDAGQQDAARWQHRTPAAHHLPNGQSDGCTARVCTRAPHWQDCGRCARRAATASASEGRAGRQQVCHQALYVKHHRCVAKPGTSARLWLLCATSCPTQRLRRARWTAAGLLYRAGLIGRCTCGPTEWYRIMQQHAVLCGHVGPVTARHGCRLSKMRGDFQCLGLLADLASVCLQAQRMDCDRRPWRAGPADGAVARRAGLSAFGPAGALRQVRCNAHSVRRSFVQCSPSGTLLERCWHLAGKMLASWISQIASCILLQAAACRVHAGTSEHLICD